MPQLHKGLHYPLAFRRDLWNGIQWRDKWPATLRISFRNWLGTYGTAYNSVPFYDVGILDYDPTKMEIVYNDTLHHGGIPGADFTWKVFVDTDRDISVQWDLNFFDGTMVHGKKHFQTGAFSAPWGLTWSSNPPGVIMTSSNHAKWFFTGAFTAQTIITGQPW